ncbi:MAG: PAS domain S-box protein [Pseudomonadota bacterium]
MAEKPADRTHGQANRKTSRKRKRAAFGAAAGIDFQRLAERSQDAIYHYDLIENKFLFANPAFIELFLGNQGRLEDLSSAVTFSRVHPDDRAMVQRSMADSMEAGRAGGEVEYRVECGGGARYVQDRWIIIRDRNGRARALEGFVRDVTTSKIADMELEASKSRALIGSYIVLDNKFKYVNPEFLRITGFTAQELYQMQPLALVHEDNREHVRENAVRMLKGELAEPYEFSVVDKDGEIKWIMETVTSIQYSGRRAALGYFMDVTKVRTMQQNLASLGLMIGAVSHSLKGLLAGLDAALYLIDTGFYRDFPARIEEGLDAAKLMLDRLGKVVYDVLYYVKERDLEPEEVDALQFAHEVAAGVETRMRGADISFSFHTGAPLGALEVDRELIRPALVNILDNALEACIMDHDKEKHFVDFTIQAEDDQVMMEIIDNGSGMDEEQIRNAFTLFYSSKGKKGTGLGLFITRKVITQHGGTVNIESTPGQGTRFCVRLPRKINRENTRPAVPVGENRRP